MTVWVVHPVRDDISGALRFGDFKFITGGYVYGDLLESTDDLAETGLAGSSSPWNYLPRSFQDALEFAARRFHPDTDYLLIVGDHLQFAALTMMLGQLHRSFMVLRYDRKLDDYIPVLLRSNLVRSPQSVLPSANIGETNDAQDRDESRYQSDPSLTATFDYYKRRPPGAS